MSLTFSHVEGYRGNGEGRLCSRVVVEKQSRSVVRRTDVISFPVSSLYPSCGGSDNGSETGRAGTVEVGYESLQLWIDSGDSAVPARKVHPNSP